MPHYLVERYLADADEETVHDLLTALGELAPAMAEQGVTYVRSWHVPHDELVISEYTAADPDAVAGANRARDLPFDRVVEAFESS